MHEALSLLLSAKTRRQICLNVIEQVSQVTAGPAKSAMMTLKNGKMQPIPLSPSVDGS
jgi:hypothetical protein